MAITIDVGFNQMNLSTQALLEVLAMVHGRKAKVSVKGKVIAARCLQCENAAVHGHRGLCEYHYHQFINARNSDERVLAAKTPRQEQDAKKKFDDAQVEAGRILASRRGKHPKTPNPFKVRIA
jgi:hypothetical protein